MSHPQNDFTSQFQSDGEAATAALTLIVNGNYHTYTPSGNDKTVNIPGVFRIYESSSGDEIVSDIQTALGGDSVPALVVETPNHNEDQYMYEGTIDTGWVFRHVGDKVIDTITVTTSGTLIRATYDLTSTLYVTIELDNGTPVTTTSWENVDDAYKSDKSIIVKKKHDGRYEVFHLKTVYSVDSKNVYVFESDQFKYNDGTGAYRTELESYSSSYIVCHLVSTSTVWDFDTYLSLTEDQRRTYVKPFVDLLLSKKQDALGWAVVNVPIGVDSYVKVCELNSPAGNLDGYYTAFSVADGDMTSTGAIPACVESGVFEIEANCHTNARAKARWSKYKSDNNIIYGSTIKEAAIVLNGTKIEVWLRLHTLNSNTRIFIKAIDNTDKAGGVAFKYSNDVVNASTTQYDTTHTLYTYPTISSQESATIELSQFSHSQAAIYTALDAAWKEEKPIFIYDDNPPAPHLSSRYIITARVGTDYFYGMSYQSSRLCGILLFYHNDSWTITRSPNIINDEIGKYVFSTSHQEISHLASDERARFFTNLKNAINGYVSVVYFKEDPNDPSVIRHYTYTNYFENANVTTFNFSNTAPINGTSMGMEMVHVAYDSGTNTVTTTTETYKWNYST